LVTHLPKYPGERVVPPPGRQPPQDRQGTDTPAGAAWGHSGRASRRRLLEGAGWRPLVITADVVATSAAVAATRPGAAALYVFPAAAIGALAASGQYHRPIATERADSLSRLAGALAVGAMATGAVALVTGTNAAAGALVRIWLMGMILVGAGRAGLFALRRRARRRSGTGRRTLVVGAGVVGRRVSATLRARPELGLVPVGYVDGPQLADGSRPGLAVLGAPAQIAEIARSVRAEHVILAFSTVGDEQLVPLVDACQDLGLEVSVVPRLFEAATDRAVVDHVGPLPLLTLRRAHPRGPGFALKYVADRALAALALVVTAPLLAAIAIAVWLTSPGPVLFRQERVGGDGAPVFEILKFRTMRMSAAPSSFELAPGAAPGGVEGIDRRTWIGRLLRRTSLDELPQLFNVLRGDMSLVGPRPERPQYVAIYGRGTRYARRHAVKGGMTGLAQIHGLRGQTSIARRLEWDLYYVRNWSFALDAKIALLTAAEVLRHTRREGA
jgi:exopolysaccharide biosynthesis polyprenyl glycosylphosphotransferase